ncbi:MAG: histidine--tRNA ligase [Bacteroidales bacterium]|nr:histidine--tRNA ligase [Bacteroidales bacterium]
MAQKPSIPKGTRDFLPLEMGRRNYIFNTIKKIFQLYGYLPIETPAMENLSTLTGKYGEEGDRLLFKILNSGDYLKKTNDFDFKEGNSNKLTSLISEKGLRYDLTVPFARFVVQHRNDIVFPFKRYQIQPVWRADKPQKGRYREFFQCDVDAIGTTSLLNELELIQIMDDVFDTLKINVEIKINNRKILSGIAEIIGFPDKIIDITIAIDKLDKIGLENVNAELLSKGISEKAIEQLQPVLNLSGTNSDKILKLKKMFSDFNSETGLKGVNEIETIFEYLENIKIKSDVTLDLTLARGLDYYTGAIFEVKAKDAKIGSICGGGRYDNLTGIFGLKDVSGVGISFGADRIYDVLEQLNAFPDYAVSSTKIMFVNFGDKEEKYCIPLLAKIRKAGINAEIYPEQAKMKKQMNYANKKNVPYVVLVGENEMKQNILSVKNMDNGEQKSISVEELIDMVK